MVGGSFSFLNSVAGMKPLHGGSAGKKRNRWPREDGDVCTTQRGRQAAGEDGLALLYSPSPSSFFLYKGNIMFQVF